MSLEDNYLETLETAALEHVNDVLADLEMDPVTHLEKGIPVKAYACPISTTIIKALDGLDYSCASYKTTSIYDSPAVNEDGPVGEYDMVYSADMGDKSFEFQRAFDRGEFPELIAE